MKKELFYEFALDYVKEHNRVLCVDDDSEKDYSLSIIVHSNEVFIFPSHSSTLGCFSRLSNLADSLSVNWYIDVFDNKPRFCAFWS